MPYLICARCQLTTYSAAVWSSTDSCPKCGADLTGRSRAAAVVPLAGQRRLRQESSRAGEARSRPLGSSLSHPSPRRPEDGAV